MSQALERIRQAARQRKKKKFTALFHHLTIDLLEDALRSNSRRTPLLAWTALTWKEYDANLERNLDDLHARLHRGAYRRCRAGECTYRSRTAASARCAVAALEDKIVQRATVAC